MSSTEKLSSQQDIDSQNTSILNSISSFDTNEIFVKPFQIKDSQNKSLNVKKIKKLKQSTKRQISDLSYETYNQIQNTLNKINNDINSSITKKNSFHQAQNPNNNVKQSQNIGDYANMPKNHINSQKPPMSMQKFHQHKPQSQVPYLNLTQNSNTNKFNSYGTYRFEQQEQNQYINKMKNQNFMSEIQQQPDNNYYRFQQNYRQSTQNLKDKQQNELHMLTKANSGQLNQQDNTQCTPKIISKTPSSIQNLEKQKEIRQQQYKSIQQKMQKHPLHKLNPIGLQNQVSQQQLENKTPSNTTNHKTYNDQPVYYKINDSYTNQVQKDQIDRNDEQKGQKIFVQKISKTQPIGQSLAGEKQYIREQILQQQLSRQNKSNQQDKVKDEITQKTSIRMPENNQKRIKIKTISQTGYHSENIQNQQQESSFDQSKHQNNDPIKRQYQKILNLNNDAQVQNYFTDGNNARQYRESNNYNFSQQQRLDDKHSIQNQQKYTPTSAQQMIDNKINYAVKILLQKKRQ